MKIVKRLHLTAALSFFLVSHAIAATTHDASFDCTKASTKAEKAICASKDLSELDQDIATDYKALPDQMRSATLVLMQREQKAWLKHRDECMIDTSMGLANHDLDSSTCLSDTMNQRLTALIALRDNEVTTLLWAVMQIPERPRESADTLRSFTKSGLAAGWLAYLARFKPESGVTSSEGKDAIKRALASIDDEYDNAMLKDELDDDKTGSGLLLLLRVLIAKNSRIDLLPCAHEFLFKEHPDLAYTAFGGIYGSYRDVGAPFCEPPDGLFKLPAWQVMSVALTMAIQRSELQTGTVVYGMFADMTADRIRMSLQPQEFAKDSDSQLEKAVSRMKNWHDFETWPSINVQRAIATVPLVEEETIAWLIKERGFTSTEATEAARGIVAYYLNERLDFFDHPDESGE